MGMLEKGGEVITEVIAIVRLSPSCRTFATTLKKGSEVHTDEHDGYNPLDRTDDHERLTVVHAEEEYVGDLGETTNSVEAHH